jgi:ribonuclease P protein component
MPRKSRLSHEELKSIAGLSGRRLHGRYLSLGVFPASHRTSIGCAVVISKRIVAQAAKRNAIRRRCRAAVAPLIKGNTEPRALMLIMKRSASDASVAALRSDIEPLLTKALRES